jgi:hypothetical protein
MKGMKTDEGDGVVRGHCEAVFPSSTAIRFVGAKESRRHPQTGVNG